MLRLPFTRHRQTFCVAEAATSYDFSAGCLYVDYIILIATLRPTAAQVLEEMDDQHCERDFRQENEEPLYLSHGSSLSQVRSSKNRPDISGH